MEICDGISDCPSNNDEKNCLIYDKFRCQASNKNLSIQYVCNDIADCDDNTDELFCRKFLHHVI